MLIGIPKERLPGESRVAATPQTVGQLIKLGFSVTLEHDAGLSASFDDDSYLAAGATLSDTQQVWQSDIVLKVNAPLDDEIALTRAGSTLVSFIWP
ncbi:MAG: NAD(P)(+) transhydrogenase (Re/Si-specific) subunit alpha, partial [Pantoea sp.]|nr:NAD(P)(+) transhydrogenase (Re/Si-specific) subunit alpha [Pantoea sp.]